MLPNFSADTVTIVADTARLRFDQPGNDNRAAHANANLLAHDDEGQQGSAEWRVISILATFSQIKDVATRRRVVDLLQSIEG